MEDVILAEEILERVEGLIHQLEGRISDNFIITEELLHQIKEELEDVINS